MKEFERFELNDVTIRQKMEYARLTAYMSNISLHSFDMEDAHFELDIIERPKAGGKAKDDSSTLCKENFLYHMKLSNIKTTLSFDHWLEVETAKTEEEWGIGFFEIQGMGFELQMEPYIQQDRLRINVVKSELSIEGH
jgi:hypothetical protein